MTTQSLPPHLDDARLDSVMGRGTSSVVWRGVDAGGAPVAVKFIPYARDAEVVAAAAMEFAALSAVAGSHVVRVHRAVPVSSPEPGLAIVMDLLDGGSLRQIVADRGRLVDGELVTVLSPVSAAVGALHSMGLVHGDLSPSNILFDRHGRPNVSDLGTAAIIGDDAAAVWGTEGFVAPEVLAGGSPTAASDVYALGALGWFAATGMAPGQAISRPPLAEAAPQVGEAMAGLLAAALSGDPGQRPDAVAWANAIFDAAAAAPLRLRIKDDDVSSLTRRIREAASDHAPGAAAGSVRPDPVKRPVMSRLRIPRPHVPRVKVALPTWLVRPRVLLARPSGAVLQRIGIAVIAAMVGMTILGLGWLALGRTAQAVDRSASDAHRVSAAPVAPPSATTSTRVTSDNAAAIIQALLTARAAIWNGAHRVNDPIDLSAVHVAGSASWHSDEQILREAATGGWTYAGVTFTAKTVAVLGPSTSQQARVAVGLDVGSYEVRGSTGVDRRPAADRQQVVLTLQRTPDGWRISQVSAS